MLNARYSDARTDSPSLGGANSRLYIGLGLVTITVLWQPLGFCMLDYEYCGPGFEWIPLLFSFFFSEIFLSSKFNRLSKVLGSETGSRSVSHIVKSNKEMYKTTVITKTYRQERAYNPTSTSREVVTKNSSAVQ